jgi:hypothetical protein
MASPNRFCQLSGVESFHMQNILHWQLQKLRKGEPLYSPASARPRQKKGSDSRNPATGETLKVPAKTVVKIRPAKAFKEVIVP